MKAFAARKIYEFGSFKIDAPERVLFDGDRAVALAPKAFDTLLLLVENVGHILSKEEMMREVWADSFVEENNLAQNISLLRKVLGKGRDGAKFIETVSKRGYRFVAPVRIVEDEDESNLVIYERTRARVLIEEETDNERQLPDNADEKNSALRLPPSAFETVETRYTRSNDVNIAYQVLGAGDLDIVFVMGWVSHLEYFWKEPHFARFLNRLASFSRLILFDKRGTGLSDRVPINELPTLEQRMDDVRCVMDAVGSKRAVLIGVSEGGPMCSLFAATYPEKTAALVMIGSYAKRIKDADYPWGVSKQDREAFFELMRRDWGKPVGVEERAPSLATDENFRDWWATYLRMGASPGAAVALTKMNAEIDVRNVLPTIRVPSLVIHRAGDMTLKVEEGRFLASKIPACKYVELAGLDHLPFVGNQDEILDEIEEFLTGVRQADEYDRVLATVMSFSIVSPENHLRQIAEWKNSVEQSQIFVRRQLELFKGRLVVTDETSVLAAFDGPARAIRCAVAITDAAQRLNLKSKTGLHTGECDVNGATLGGFAVRLARQIGERAAVGEVLVSQTVKDLVAGSGIVFDERGGASFSGADGEWNLFAVKK